MPDYRRLYVPGGTYFFTVNLANRQSTLLTDEIEKLRIAYRAVSKTWPFATVAICILPDHLHCIWSLPEGDANFSTRWRLIKLNFSKSLAKTDDPAQGRRPGERGIWQRRFWEHLVRDEQDLETCINYVYGNPVKHGLVAEIPYWPYSSWHRDQKENP